MLHVSGALPEYMALGTFELYLYADVSDHKIYYVAFTQYKLPVMFYIGTYKKLLYL